MPKRERVFVECVGFTGNPVRFEAEAVQGLFQIPHADEMEGLRHPGPYTIVVHVTWNCSRRPEHQEPYLSFKPARCPSCGRPMRKGRVYTEIVDGTIVQIQAKVAAALAGISVET
jgi:hypothetical protein